MVKKEERYRIATILDKKGLKTKDMVRNLIDSDTIFKNIARLREFMSNSKDDLEQRIHAFISSRVDYCNGLFTCQIPLNSFKLYKMQQQEIKTNKKKLTEHITPILKSIHWLPAGYRIDFKVAYCGLFLNGLMG